MSSLELCTRHHHSNLCAKYDPTPVEQIIRLSMVLGIQSDIRSADSWTTRFNVKISKVVN
jgi:hypothetical protein